MECTAPKTRGRPRAFDADRALDQAMRVFWKHGYEGASLPALTRAMGINRPSLYAAFGNKEALFRKAIDRYIEKSGVMIAAALAQPTARAVAEHLLRDSVDRSAASSVRGCMLVQSALACAQSSDRLRRELASRRAEVEKALHSRFIRAQEQSDLPPRADPAALAKFVVTLLHGISVQMNAGATRDQMQAAIDVAMAGWPK